MGLGFMVCLSWVFRYGRHCAGSLFFAVDVVVYCLGVLHLRFQVFIAGDFLAQLLERVERISGFVCPLVGANAFADVVD